MTRTCPRTAAAALTAAVALLLTLTACGGDDKDASNPDKIAGANSAPPTSASPSASAASAASSGTGSTPTFDLPSDVKVNIEGFSSSDTTKKAVLRDTSYAIKTMLEALAEGNGDSVNFKRYFTGLHAAELADTIISYHKSGLTITGTYNYYQPTVKLSGDSRASVTYCEDQRKAYDKVIKTQKINTTTPSLKDFRQWGLGLAKNSSGDWQVVSYVRTEGVKACQVS